MKDYRINIVPSEEDDGYIADVPDLEACSAFGATPEEALREVQIAKHAWLTAAREAGRLVPTPNNATSNTAEQRKTGHAGDDQTYLALWRRLDHVVDRLTADGKIQEADYLMIRFFIFFNQIEKLEEHVASAARMLQDGEW